MEVANRNPEWRVLGGTVRGMSHRIAELPNQDAIGWWPEHGQGPPSILAVADGHGSRKSFRSAIGARMAVEAARTAYEPILTGAFDEVGLPEGRRWAEERLPHALVRLWTESVVRDFSENAFTCADFIRLEEAGPVVAYGTTILTVAVAESFIIYLQLGDGDIITVSEEGDVSRPLPRDERLIANQTTSLSMPKAWREFRMRVQPRLHGQPVLILVSTDGLANCFTAPEGFLKVGTDILDMVRAEGLGLVDENLESWLDDFSRDGSGDDISLGILCRADSRHAPIASRRLEASERSPASAAGDQPRSHAELEL